MAKIDIPEYKDQEELFDFLIENKELHITEKKNSIKKADAIQHQFPSPIGKSDPVDVTGKNRIEVESIINTTKVMDSHHDVHINGIWRKSLRESKEIILLQEHRMTFDHLISDQVKATAEIKTWKELGFRRFKGDTEALIFKSLVERDVNEFMFNKYAKAQVKNHSVGMHYVKLFLAINSEESSRAEEKAVWDKYINIIVNRKTAESLGFFWAVTEAKVIEGSAVVKGSNTLTPTTSVEVKNTDEPPEGTPPTEPSEDTLKRKRILM